MAVIHAVGSILSTIVGGIASVLRATINCITCRSGGGGGGMRRRRKV